MGYPSLNKDIVHATGLGTITAALAPTAIVTTSTELISTYNPEATQIIQEIAAISSAHNMIVAISLACAIAPILGISKNIVQRTWEFIEPEIVTKD